MTAPALEKNDTFWNLQAPLPPLVGASPDATIRHGRQFFVYHVMYRKRSLCLVKKKERCVCQTKTRFWGVTFEGFLFGARLGRTYNVGINNTGCLIYPAVSTNKLPGKFRSSSERHVCVHGRFSIAMPIGSTYVIFTYMQFTCS